MDTELKTLVLRAGEAGAEVRGKDVAALIAKVVGAPDVAAARGQWNDATSRLELLSTRQAAINAAFAKADTNFRQSRRAFIDAACSEGEMPVKADDVANALSYRNELTVALSELVEQRIPRAEIQELCAHAEFLEASSKALTREAAARMQQTLVKLAPVLKAEGNIAFDPTKTLSGALQRKAAEMLEQANALRQQAAEKAKRFKIQLWS